MADLLNRLSQDQKRRDNADLAQANGHVQWAETFNSTPPPEVQRARLNYADTVDRAFSNKLALEARTDAKALDLMAKAAEFEEWKAQAPLRNQLLQERVAATGATERRKAEEAAIEARHTAALNNGMLDLYKRGVRPGTPEYLEAGAALLADNYMADAQQSMDFGKRFGIPGETPEEKRANAVKTVTEVTRAREEEKQKYAKTPAQIEDEAFRRARGTASGKPPKSGNESVDKGAASAYTKALGELSGLYETKKSMKEPDQKTLSSIAKNEEIVRSLESQNPNLRATRGLPVEPASAPTPATAAPALKAMDENIISSARAAIAAGKDAAAVAKRLQENGYDPTGL